MQGLLNILVVLIVPVMVYAQTPVLEWGYGFGGQYNDEAHTVAIDSSGNHYICGSFLGTVDFDPSEQGVHELVSDWWDIFVLKLDTAGAFVHVWQIGGPGPDGVSSPPPHTGGFSRKSQMDFDADGNVYLAVYTGANADVDPGTGLANIGSEQDNLVVMKLDEAGTLLWYHVFSEGAYALNLHSMTLGSTDAIYILGTCEDGLDLNPSPTDSFVVSTPVNNNGRCVCLSKFSSDGEFQWAGLLPPKPSSGELGHGLAVEDKAAVAACPNGDIVVTGFFHEDRDFHLPSDSIQLSGTGLSEIFVTRLTSEGDLVWNRHLEGIDSTAFGITSSVVVSSSDEIYVAGSMEGTAIDFDPGPDQFLLNEEGWFLLKLNGNGDFEWAVNHGTENRFSRFREVTIDRNGDPWVLFTYGDTLELTTETSSVSMAHPGFEGTGIMKFDPMGTAQWAGAFVSTASVYDFVFTHWDIDAHPNGGVLASGTFRKDTIDVGFGQVSNQIPSEGAADAYLLRLMDDNLVGVPSRENPENGVFVYPNPTVDNFHVRLPNGCASASYRVLSATGSNIIEGFVQDKGRVTLPPSTAKGIYLVQLNPCHKSYTIKLLVQ